MGLVITSSLTLRPDAAAGGAARSTEGISADGAGGPSFECGLNLQIVYAMNRVMADHFGVPAGQASAQPCYFSGSKVLRSSAHE
jgi:hypothetical protein